MFSGVLPNCNGPTNRAGILGISTAILDAAAWAFWAWCATAFTGMGHHVADAREFVLRAWWS